MNTLESIKSSLTNHIEQVLSVPKNILQSIDISLNIDQAKQQFGDLTTNCAMIIAHSNKENPRKVAEKIIEKFSHPSIEKFEIAGPGFINIFLTVNSIKEIAREIYTQKNNYFLLNKNLKNYSIEFVSANPTGPLHLGHGRGGIIGDVLGNILKYLGHKVTKEFYINDAGVQITKLGNSLKIRIEQELGKSVELPEDAYHGAYLITLAQQCIKQFGKDVVNKSDDFFKDYGKEHLLNQIKVTLSNYGINFDVWFSEKNLHESKAIEHSLKKLEANGHLYEQDGALWFRSTTFGDDKDRVLRKNTGEYTYVAPDVAYLENKLDRGFDHLIMTLGQDHHSYVSRLKGILQALGYNKDLLDIILYQLVTLKESGEIVRMSKRTGKIVSLEDIIETVGKDVARFFYLNKKADAHLEFDIELALKKTDENPVYYIQYAYVRTNSILQKANQHPEFLNITESDTLFMTDSERLLIKKIASLKDLLKNIGSNYQTHLLSYYCIELSQLFHSYYGANRVINLEDINQSRGRLFMILLIKQTLKECFDLLGISAPENM